MEQGKVFGLHELKTVEIDVEKKIFRINGEDFGRDCTGFHLICSPADRNDDFYKVSMDFHSVLEFRANFDDRGHMKSSGVAKLKRHLLWRRLR